MIQPFAKVLHPVLGLRTHSFWMGTPAAIISRNPTSANNSSNENCRMLSGPGKLNEMKPERRLEVRETNIQNGGSHHFVFVWYPVHLLCYLLLNMFILWWASLFDIYGFSGDPCAWTDPNPPAVIPKVHTTWNPGWFRTKMSTIKSTIPWIMVRMVNRWQ